MFIYILAAYFGLGFIIIGLRAMYNIGYKDGDRDARISHMIELTKGSH